VTFFKSKTQSHKRLAYPQHLPDTKMFPEWKWTLSVSICIRQYSRRI